MKQTLITIALTLGLGFLSTPSFASGYVVNGHAASPPRRSTWSPAASSRAHGWPTGMASRQRIAHPSPLQRPHRTPAARSATTSWTCFALRLIKGQPKHERPLPCFIVGRVAWAPFALIWDVNHQGSRNPVEAVLGAQRDTMVEWCPHWIAAPCRPRACGGERGEAMVRNS